MGMKEAAESPGKVKTYRPLDGNFTTVDSVRHVRENPRDIALDPDAETDVAAESPDKEDTYEPLHGSSIAAASVRDDKEKLPDTMDFLDGDVVGDNDFLNGDEVRLVGLQAKPLWNGAAGVLIQFDPANGRWQVAAGGL